MAHAEWMMMLTSLHHTQNLLDCQSRCLATELHVVHVTLSKCYTCWSWSYMEASLHVHIVCAHVHLRSISCKQEAHLCMHLANCTILQKP